MCAENELISAVGDCADLERMRSQLLPWLEVRKVLKSDKSRGDNETLIKKLYDEVFNGQHLEALDDFFAEDYIDHSGLVNRDGMRRVLSDFFRVFVEIAFKVEDLISEGDEVVVRALAIFKNEDWSKSISQIAVYRLRDGKIVESWAHSDSFF